MVVVFKSFSLYLLLGVSFFWNICSYSDSFLLCVTGTPFSFLHALFVLHILWFFSIICGEVIYLSWMFSILNLFCTCITTLLLRFDNFLLWFYWIYFLCLWHEILLLLCPWFVQCVNDDMFHGCPMFCLFSYWFNFIIVIMF